MSDAFVDIEGYRGTGLDVGIFTLRGSATGKRRNEVEVGMVHPWLLKRWRIASDETVRLNGDESAPEPLSLFSAGLVTCFMTQLRTFSRHCGVELKGVAVDAELSWFRRNGDSPRDPYVALPRTFRLDIQLDTEAGLESQQRLVRAASDGCFVEAVLSVPVSHRLWTGFDWVDCDTPSRSNGSLRHRGDA